MSRLHVITASAGDVAAYFEAEPPSGLTTPEGDIKEGLTGLVIFEKDGRRLLRPVTWGFPRLTREMRERGEPPGLSLSHRADPFRKPRRDPRREDPDLVFGEGSADHVVGGFLPEPPGPRACLCRHDDERECGRHAD